MACVIICVKLRCVNLMINDRCKIARFFPMFLSQSLKNDAIETYKRARPPHDVLLKSLSLDEVRKWSLPILCYHLLQSILIQDIYVPSSSIYNITCLFTGLSCHHESEGKFKFHVALYVKLFVVICLVLKATRMLIHYFLVFRDNCLNWCFA